MEGYEHYLWGDVSVGAEAVVSYLEKLRAMPMPAYNFKAAQQAHLSALNLKPGNVNRTVGDENMQHFQNERQSLADAAAVKHAALPLIEKIRCALLRHKPYHPSYSVYAKMVQEKGLYPTEIACAAKRALDVPSGEGFCHDWLKETSGSRGV